jgi:O-antigen/teichoic acid export membrane protein
MSIAADIWGEIASRVGALRRSESARRNAGNSISGVVDTFARPVIVVATSPYFVHKLGLDLFGLWMLVNAVSGSYSVFNLGFGDATMKYVSAYLGRKDAEGAGRIMRASFTATCGIGTVIAAAVFFVAPWLAHSVFKIAPALHPIAIRAIQIGGLLLALRSVEYVLVAFIRAYERYEIAARITVVTKVVAIIAAVALVAAGFSILSILGTTLAATLASVVVLAISAKRLHPGLSLVPGIDRRSWRELAHFGGYTWLQNLSGVAFDQMDKLMIGSFLGTPAVAYYVLCLQLTQPIHMLASSAFNFVFPLFSHRRESGKHRLDSAFRSAMMANIVLAAIVTLPLFFFSRTILRIWMGPAFAAHSFVLLSVLAVAFGALAINVVPYYTLLSVGRVRLVSLLSLFSGILTLVSMSVLVPRYQLIGAACSRFLYAGILAVPFIVAARRSVVTIGNDQTPEYAAAPSS